MTDRPASDPDDHDPVPGDEPTEPTDSSEPTEPVAPAEASARPFGTAAPTTASVGATPRGRTSRSAPAPAKAPTVSELAVRVTDNASKAFVIGAVAVFVAILLNGFFLGRGGLLAPKPTAIPAVSAAPSASARVSASPSASPSASSSSSASPSSSVSARPSASPSPSRSSSTTASASPSP